MPPRGGWKPEKGGPAGRDSRPRRGCMLLLGTPGMMGLQRVQFLAQFWCELREELLAWQLGAHFMEHLPARWPPLWVPCVLRQSNGPAGHLVVLLRQLDRRESRSDRCGGRQRNADPGRPWCETVKGARSSDPETVACVTCTGDPGRVKIDDHNAARTFSGTFACGNARRRNDPHGAVGNLGREIPQVVTRGPGAGASDAPGFRWPPR